MMNELEVNKYEKNNHKLTNRETECLYWASRGKSAEETALILRIKKKTVRHYIEKAKFKLDAIKITQAVYIATKKGIL